MYARFIVIASILLYPLTSYKYWSICCFLSARTPSDFLPGPLKVERIIQYCVQCNDKFHLSTVIGRIFRKTLMFIIHYWTWSFLVSFRNCNTYTYILVSIFVFKTLRKIFRSSRSRPCNSWTKNLINERIITIWLYL